MPEGDYYASHLGLIRQMDRAFSEQGRLDPATWLEIDKQILDCHEKRLLSTGQYVQLHSIIENRLRRATLLGWS